jgi:hypothetical protein
MLVAAGGVALRVLTRLRDELRRQNDELDHLRYHRSPKRGYDALLSNRHLATRYVSPGEEPALEDGTSHRLDRVSFVGRNQ